MIYAPDSEAKDQREGAIRASNLTLVARCNKRSYCVKLPSKKMQSRCALPPSNSTRHQRQHLPDPPLSHWHPHAPESIFTSQIAKQTPNTRTQSLRSSSCRNTSLRSFQVLISTTHLPLYIHPCNFTSALRQHRAR